MDLNIENETFAEAYKCLNGANKLLETGLGNFSELDSSALFLIGISDIKNKNRLDTMIDECQHLKNNMFHTIQILSQMNVESAIYFSDILNDASFEELRTVGATIGMGVTKFGEGIFTAGEQILDGFASLGGFIVGIFDDESAEKIGNWIEKDHVGDAFAKAYADGGMLSSIEKYSLFSSQSTAANVIKGFGIASGYVAVASLTAGVGSAVGGGSFIAGASAGANSIGVNALVAGLGGLGSGTQDDLQAGNNFDDAFSEGIKRGSTQTVLSAGAGMIAKGVTSALGNVTDDVASAVVNGSDEVSLAVVNGSDDVVKVASDLGDDVVKAASGLGDDAAKTASGLDSTVGVNNSVDDILSNINDGKMTREQVIQEVKNGNISRETAIDALNEKMKQINSDYSNKIIDKKTYHQEMKKWNADHSGLYSKGFETASINVGTNVVDDASRVASSLDDNAMVLFLEGSTNSVDELGLAIVNGSDEVSLATINRSGEVGNLLENVVSNVGDDVARQNFKLGSVPIATIASNTVYETNNLLNDNINFEISGDTPIIPNDVPKTPNDTPIIPNDVPKTPNDTPIIPNDVPKTPNDTPITPNDVPKTPNDTPTIPNDVPKTPNDTPITPNGSPEIMTNDIMSKDNLSNLNGTVSMGASNISNSIINSDGAILNSYNGAVIDSNNITDSYNTTNNYYQTDEKLKVNNDDGNSDTLKTIIGLGVAGLAGATTAVGYGAFKDKKEKKKNNNDDFIL